MQTLHQTVQKCKNCFYPKPITLDEDEDICKNERELSEYFELCMKAIPYQEPMSGEDYEVLIRKKILNT